MYSELNYVNKLFHPLISQKLQSVVNDGYSKSPVILDVDLTSKCNYGCPLCVSRNGLSNETIPFSFLVKLLKEFSNMGGLGIVFSGGGEPLLYPNMPLPFSLCKKHGLEYGLVTNGYFLDKYMQEIADTAAWTRVSIDAATASTYEKMRPSGNKGTFNKVISSMEVLAKKKTGKLGYSFLLVQDAETQRLPSNMHEVVAAASIAKQSGCDYFEFKPTVDIHHVLLAYSKKERALLGDTLSELKAMQTDTFRILYPMSVEMVLNEDDLEQSKQYKRCPHLELRTLVTPKGIFPCPYKRDFTDACYGQVEGSFSRFWNSEHRRGKTLSINPRKECRFFCNRHDTNTFIFELISDRGCITNKDFKTDDGKYLEDIFI